MNKVEAEFENMKKQFGSVDHAKDGSDISYDGEENLMDVPMRKGKSISRYSSKHSMPNRNKAQSDTISAGFGNNESELDEADFANGSTHGLYEGGRNSNDLNNPNTFANLSKDQNMRLRKNESPTRVHEYTPPEQYTSD